MQRSISLVALGLTSTLGACASSVLLRHDDGAFTHSQQRLARTEDELEREEPRVAEKRLFLQAEGFYRYRFAPTARTVQSYLAQAAAVTFDFPALQALSGSLDLLELRVKAADGAVHLWETLLDQYPATPLRPLTLYRLGWAYRNTGVAGFPRKSGDEAFDQLVRDYPASPLTPLALAARSVTWKSKDTVTSLSVVPGLGQMYVGEHLSGGVRLAAAIASIAMIVVPVYVGYPRRDDLMWGGDWPLLACGLGGLILLSVDYTTAYQDAVRGVVQWNERAEARFEIEHPEAP